MTAFETLSLVTQFSLSLIAILSLIVSVVVFLKKRSDRPRPMDSDYFLY